MGRKKKPNPTAGEKAVANLKCIHGEPFEGPCISCAMLAKRPSKKAPPGMMMDQDNVPIRLPTCSNRACNRKVANAKDQYCCGFCYMTYWNDRYFRAHSRGCEDRHNAAAS